jgi:hypothetical protein
MKVVVVVLTTCCLSFESSSVLSGAGVGADAAESDASSSTAFGAG